MWTQEAKLQAEEPRPREWAGFAVDIDGATAVVGAPSYRTDDRPGRVFVFEKGAHGWLHNTTLTGEHKGDAFGVAVALKGDTLVVGASRGDTPDAEFAGGVYVYERGSDGAWGRAAWFAGEDSTLGDEFGSALALDGGTLVVGAKLDEPNGLRWEGSAYVFERTTSGWMQQAKLVPEDPEELARFGSAVDVDGETILVGVVRQDAQATAGGTAFVFERTTDGWMQTAQLWPADPGEFHRFGRSVTLDGDRAAIGSPGQIAFSYPGAAYIFERDATSGWTQVAQVDGDGDPENTFGRSVQLEDDRLVVGAPLADDIDYPDPAPQLARQGGLFGSGAVFVFEQGNGSWRQTAKFMAEDRGRMGPVPTDDGVDLGDWDQDYFGHDVAFEGSRVLVGAYGDDTEAGEATGMAYAFTRGCQGPAVPSPLSPPLSPCPRSGGALG